MNSPRSWFITGGAGFLGSHLVDRLLAGMHRVIVYDNFSSGKREYLPHNLWRIYESDCANLGELCSRMSAWDVVVHLASNPDISKASVDPDLDFRNGTMLTRNVLEAARRSGVKEFIYASGSGVYGDRGETLLTERDLALPVSPYGASKLAGEGLVAAYTGMFDWKSTILRFGNIVGPRQTHGVARDFIRKLRADPSRLEILGDGTQSKPFVHVHDAVAGMLRAHDSHSTGTRVFNVAPADQITVRQVAEIAAGAVGARPEFVLGTGPRGWPGDVPVVRLDSSKLHALGWNPLGSFQAMTEACSALAGEIR